MKNTISKTIGTMTLAMLALAVFMQISVSAQQEEDIVNKQQIEEQTLEDLSVQGENSKRLEGSWNHQGMRLNCQTGAILGAFSAMFTFSQGGTFWESGTQISPALRSPSHGVWNHQNGRHYNTAFQFFRFNADGTLAGKQIVRQQIEVSRSGDSYTATATAQVLDTSGNVIANNCAAGTGTRFE